jgi:Fe-S cluster biosynthesis and repair protein YggX
MPQVTMLHFFKFSGFKNSYWAFKMMQMNHLPLKKVKGLDFYKLLGTGGGDGYQWKPDFSTYALLTVFSDESAADEFILNSNIYKDYKSRASNFSTIWLSPFAAHGEWSKKQPFLLNEFQENLPVAIITRARIKFRFLYKFWKLVPFVSESIKDVEGPLFGKGIGEWPLIQQATFSIWRNKQTMIDFAYKSKLHQKAIKNTRQLNWYSEEMFVRFHPIKVEGNLININIL